LDLEKIYEQDPSPSRPSDEFLLSKLFESKGLSMDAVSFDRTCWFHLTRTHPANKFEQGLLPLDRYVDSIWNFLFSLLKGDITKKEWNDFRHCIETNFPNHFAHLYRLKINDSFHWGPHAILVKDVAFREQEVGAHNYFRTPEIVEDICTCFEKKYNMDLSDRFIKNTVPCIVKFCEDEAEFSYLKPALMYLYCVYREYAFSHYCNTCFDGEGKVIGEDKILRVEFLGEK